MIHSKPLIALDKSKFLSLILFTGIASAALFASSLQAELIVNGDFEAYDFTGDQVDDDAIFPNWTVSAGFARGDEDTGGSVPGTNPNQVVRMGAVGNQGTNVMYQDISHNWATSDEYDLSFNAVTVYWKTSAASLSFSLQQQDDSGTELWNSGEVQLDLHPGEGSLVEVDDWTDGTDGTKDMTFDFSIDASTFSAGTAGESLRLQVEQESGILWLDNVSLANIPEPSSVALLALGGLSLLFNRRQRRS